MVPSPYQRDLFGALNALPEIRLQVDYLEGAAPDSPWAKSPLRDWERILPGRALTLGQGRLRSHLHWPLPSISKEQADLVVLNVPTTAVTAQWLFRTVAPPFLFWGERLLVHPSRAKALIQAALRSPLKRAAGLIGIGSLARDQYQSFFPSQEVANLPYHCDLAPFAEAATQAQRAQDSGKEVRFLFAGQMIARKGFDLFLEAFDQVHRMRPETRAILVGRPTEESEGLVRSLAPATRAAIKDRGFVQPEELPAVFSEADVMVLPSRHDGWGVVVNQALGAGLPVLASDAVGAAIDLLEPGENGFLHPAGDAEDLARHMLALLDRPTRQKMSLAASARAKDLSPEAGASRFLEILSRFR